MMPYKILSIDIGIAIIFVFLTSFLNSESPLDLILISIGIMAIIIGFSYQEEKINRTITYFVGMFSVNLFQWLIVIYILLFISKIQLYGDFLIILSIAPLTTISLIIQIRTSDLKYLGNHRKGNKDVLLADKLKGMLDDKAKLVLIFAGCMIILACLGSFIFSRSPLELFGSSIGVLTIIYGYYRQGKKDNQITYSPGMSNLKWYREAKKVKVTYNYFLAMSGVLIFQWLLITYFCSNLRGYSSQDIATAFTISFFATMCFYIQIRESNLKYIGIMRDESDGTMENNGFLVCNKCNGYYKLRSGESPQDFTDQCECGGELKHYENYNTIH